MNYNALDMDKEIVEIFYFLMKEYIFVLYFLFRHMMGAGKYQFIAIVAIV